MEYYQLAQKYVLSVLKENSYTFDDLCKKCHGLYPTHIKKILDDLNIHTTLTELYVTKPELVPLCNDEYVATTIDAITEVVENNPILSSWYFSWNTCLKISQLDTWNDKKIAFLGTPRLFEYFIIRGLGKTLTLIDLDTTITSAINQKYKNIISNKNISIYNLDINSICEKSISEQFDYIFLDPPWYPEYYISWIDKASKLLNNKGSIIFSIFPHLLRPLADKERIEIFKKCRKSFENFYLISDALEYDIPSFEKKELEQEKVILHGNWKISDMVILNNSKNDMFNNEKVDFQSYSMWKEFDLLNTRWFLNVQDNNDNNNEPLVSLPNNSYFLKTPSRRNQQLLNINLLSSKGHGIKISNTTKFLSLVSDIQKNESVISYNKIIETAKIDDESKKVLLGLEKTI